MCLNNIIPKLITMSAAYHNISRLLLLTIIVVSKNCMILVIDKENIPVNRQNWLIAHPHYTASDIMSKSSTNHVRLA